MNVDTTETTYNNSNASHDEDGRESLTLATITEQQRIITSLQEIIIALKAKVDLLETEKKIQQQQQQQQAANSSVSGSNAERGGGEGVKKTLHTALAAKYAREAQALQAENAALEEQLRAFSEHTDTLAEREAMVAANQARALAAYREKESLWAQERAVLRLASRHSCQLEQEAALLRGELERAAVYRARWRALVVTLAQRVPGTEGEQAMAYADALSEMERREMPQPAPTRLFTLAQAEEELKRQKRIIIVDDSTLEKSQDDASGAAADGKKKKTKKKGAKKRIEQEKEKGEGGVDPEDVRAVWNRKAESKPRGTVDSFPPILPTADNTHTDHDISVDSSEAAATHPLTIRKTKKHGRFLVPM